MANGQQVQPAFVYFLLSAQPNLVPPKNVMPTTFGANYLCISMILFAGTVSAFSESIPSTNSIGSQWLISLTLNTVVYADISIAYTGAAQSQRILNSLYVLIRSTSFQSFSLVLRSPRATTIRIKIICLSLLNQLSLHPQFEWRNCKSTFSLSVQTVRRPQPAARRRESYGQWIKECKTKSFPQNNIV